MRNPPKMALLKTTANNYPEQCSNLVPKFYFQGHLVKKKGNPLPVKISTHLGAEIYPLWKGLDLTPHSFFCLWEKCKKDKNHRMKWMQRHTFLWKNTTSILSIADESIGQWRALDFAYSPSSSTLCYIALLKMLKNARQPWNWLSKTNCVNIWLGLSSSPYIILYCGEEQYSESFFSLIL